jgi:metal-dependent amidase/aminoacylase/carboxypeptidase family protein
VKPGIIVMSELHGDVAARVLDVQRRFDPRMAAELPPHVTITGSSGVGPISPDTTEDELIAALEPVAAATAPFAVQLQPPMQFMQSTVVCTSGSSRAGCRTRGHASLSHPTSR